MEIRTEGRGVKAAEEETPRSLYLLEASFPHRSSPRTEKKFSAVNCKQRERSTAPRSGIDFHALAAQVRRGTGRNGYRSGGPRPDGRKLSFHFHTGWERPGPSVPTYPPTHQSNAVRSDSLNETYEIVTQ